MTPLLTGSRPPQAGEGETVMIKAKGSERKELLISITIIFLSLSLSYFLAFRPRIREISRAKQALQDIQTPLGEASQAIPEVEKYEKESSLLELEMVSLKTKIPPEQQLPQLLDKLRRIAREAGIDDLSLSTANEQLVSFQDGWTPGTNPAKVNPPAPPPTGSSTPPGKASQGTSFSISDSGEGKVSSFPSQDLYRIPVAIKAKGKYRSLAKFLEEIPRSDRLLTVRSLRLQRVEEIIPLIRAEIQIDAYYLRPQGQDRRENLRR